jgi:hypothetical protein
MKLLNITLLTFLCFSASAEPLIDGPYVFHKEKSKEKTGSDTIFISVTRPPSRP